MANIILYHSTLGWRVIKKKRRARNLDHGEVAVGARQRSGSGYWDFGIRSLASGLKLQLSDCELAR